MLAARITSEISRHNPKGPPAWRSSPPGRIWPCGCRSEELRCQPGKIYHRKRPGQQTKIDLEQEHTIGDPFRLQLLNQFFEGSIRMRKCSKRDFLHPLQRFPKVWVPRKIGAQNQCVTKTTYQPSSSGKLRPAIGVPTTISCWPEYSESSA